MCKILRQEHLSNCCTVHNFIREIDPTKKISEGEDEDNLLEESDVALWLIPEWFEYHANCMT